MLLQAIDSAIRQGAQEAHWIPSHAERRKRSRHTWTRDEWGNHLADKVAEGDRLHVMNTTPQAQWTVVTALDALELLRGEGELYIGDYRGQPKALHGIMDAVHTIRHERYTLHRDTTLGAGYYWQDNTLSLSASIFNGNSKSTGHHAHTARMVYDKHWHGRNRAKNSRLTTEERDETATCHLCGGTDSQSHAFRSCTHDNISAICMQTYDAMQDLIKNHKHTAGDRARDMDSQ